MANSECDVRHSESSAVELSHQAFKRILLVKPSSLGDIVHALPVLHGLRVRYPEARIDWLIASPFAPLVAGHEDVDELVLFDRRRFGQLGRSSTAAGEFVRFVRGLRKRRYDLVVDIQGLFRAGFLTWMTGAPVRIGFRDAREGAWVFYTHHIPPADPEMHAVDRNYRVAELLGFGRVPVQFKLPLPGLVRPEVEAFLQDFGVPDPALITLDHRGVSAYTRGRWCGKPLIVVAPGARWETKVWPAERFSEIIDRLGEGYGGRCLLVGGGDEVDRCEQVVERCRRKPVNLAGRTSLPQLAFVVGLADLVICHDSAVAHLAVALDRRLVCIIGPTSPQRTGPYRRTEDVVRLNLDCSPCYLRRLRQCCYHHRCMSELDVDAVFAAAERALGVRTIADAE